MCEPPRLPRSSLLHVLVGAAVATTALCLPRAAAQADVEDPLSGIQEERQGLQDRLEQLHRVTAELDAQAAEAAARFEMLRAQAAAQGEAADAAEVALARHLRESYKRGSLTAGLSLLSAAAPSQAAEQARLLGVLDEHRRGQLEEAAAAQRRAEATAGQAERSFDDLRSKRAELDAAEDQAAGLLAEVERREQVLQASLAAQQEAGQPRTVTVRASRSSAEVSRSPVSDGQLACPVASPRSYSDTYGASRSGGRRHKGTDILAPRGADIYAIEGGTVTRLSGNHLGGISLYLQAHNGTVYYYTHLAGYVDGLGAGMQVKTGEQVGYNGDTGNARGIPHLHLEVLPGGGANVNPYPYVVRACG